ncbi:hypothetical protein [Halorubrum halodurans]|uniref:hypothetical protein n=1 Tax=Halorubrum halodurans TaxID=1383851 RepID=UPI00117AB1E0|nr:hypothetical protein [Halorubrum halodurans]
MVDTEQTTLFVRDPDDETPEGVCLNWHDCRAYPAGPNPICDECLDRIRDRDSTAEYENYADYLRDVA